MRNFLIAGATVLLTFALDEVLRGHHDYLTIFLCVWFGAMGRQVTDERLFR
jgi:hypothetical protein